MANASILAAFERMWQHVVAALGNKANASDITDLQSQIDGKSASGHNHDDRYYTESEINTKLSGKSDATHNHDGQYTLVKMVRW